MKINLKKAPNRAICDRNLAHNACNITLIQVVSTNGESRTRRGASSTKTTHKYDKGEPPPINIATCSL